MGHPAVGWKFINISEHVVPSYLCAKTMQSCSFIVAARTASNPTSFYVHSRNIMLNLKNPTSVYIH
jgi:hypothetical protein